MAQRSVRHMLNCGLARGWASWAMLASKRERQLGALVRSVCHAAAGDLSKSWSSWVGTVAERQRKLDVVERAATFIVNRALVGGLVCWRERA
eukprot:3343784-Prymnesium_polylepis.1